MDILDKILDTKKREIENLETLPKQKLDKPHIFLETLQKKEFFIIGEIKRRSPSVPNIDAVKDPQKLAKTYEMAGIDAISCLTDKTYFGGSLDDLRSVTSVVKIPVLRKDFFIEPIQFDEAILAGASCVLLIVAALKNSLEILYREAKERGLDSLIEVHNEEELERALDLNPSFIGINNRNLKTFKTDLQTSLRLKPRVPRGVTLISESGMASPAAVCQVKEWGFQGALVGEALVRSNDPKAFVKEVYAH